MKDHFSLMSILSLYYICNCMNVSKTFKVSFEVHYMYMYDYVILDENNIEMN